MSIGPKMVKAIRLIFDANHPSQTSVLEENGIFIKRDDILKEWVRRLMDNKLNWGLKT